MKLDFYKERNKKFCLKFLGSKTNKKKEYEIEEVVVSLESTNVNDFTSWFRDFLIFMKNKKIIIIKDTIIHRCIILDPRYNASFESKIFDLNSASLSFPDNYHFFINRKPYEFNRQLELEF